MAIPGILGRKLSMTQLFRPDGRLEAATVIEAGPCVVTQVKTKERDGYDAIQVGYAPARRLNKPEAGHLKGLEPLRYLRELRVEGPVEVERGQRYDVSIFQPGEWVDVIGRSKGRGFAGGVKRHHFAGGPKTHGQSDRHRAPGSVGSTTDPGKVLKGQRMAGHMGNQRVTVQHLEVLAVDPQRNLLVLKGAVPGARNGLLLIRRSRRQPKTASTAVAAR